MRGKGKGEEKDEGEKEDEEEEEKDEGEKEDEEEEEKEDEDGGLFVVSSCLTLLIQAVRSLAFRRCVYARHFLRSLKAS